MQLKQIISGGQTGIDRAALDVAQQLGIRCGGWCPRGRKAEDGPIDHKYPLWETPSARYTERTEWNVRVGDATLILAIGPLTGGTALTKSLADNLGKPCLVIDLTQPLDKTGVFDWLTTQKVKVLNIAGPRESTSPGIYEQSHTYLNQLLRTDSHTKRQYTTPLPPGEGQLPSQRRRKQGEGPMAHTLIVFP